MATCEGIIAYQKDQPETGLPEIFKSMTVEECREFMSYEVVDDDQPILMPSPYLAVFLMVFLFAYVIIRSASEMGSDA